MTILSKTEANMDTTTVFMCAHRLPHNSYPGYETKLSAHYIDKWSRPVLFAWNVLPLQAVKVVLFDAIYLIVILKD